MSASPLPPPYVPSSPPTVYVQAEPAAGLASEHRSITLNPPVLQVVNRIIDELLYKIIVALARQSSETSHAAPLGLQEGGGGSGGDGRVDLPITTHAFKHALLSTMTTHSLLLLAKDAILEAEMGQVEWIRSRGKNSDPAGPTPASVSKTTAGVVRVKNIVRTGSRQTTGSGSETEQQGRIAPPPRPDERVSVAQIHSELRAALSSLSPYGARSDFPMSTGSQAMAAIKIVQEGQVELKCATITPLLLLYTSSVISYIIAYLVRGCARVVERDPSSSIVKLTDLVELMGEDQRLFGLWDDMTIKEVVDREIQSSASSSGLRVGRGAGGAASPSFPTSSTATLSSTASLLNPHPSTLLARRGSQKRSITARLGLAIVTGGASDGRERERERDHGLLSITEGSTVTGGSSRRPSGSSTASSSSSPNLPPVQEALASSIPFKTTPGLPADPSSKRSTDADTDTLPSSALTWMEFAEMDGDGQENNDRPDPHKRSVSVSSKHKSGKASSTTTPAGLPRPSTSSSVNSGSGSGRRGLGSASAEWNEDFENLIANGQTVKMSLTPSRFVYSNGSSLEQPTLAQTRATVRSSAPAVSSSSSSSLPPQNPSPRRLQARSARPSKSFFNDDSSATEGDEGNRDALEMLEEGEEEDPLVGTRGKSSTRTKRADKETLFDILNSEPPWAANEGSSRRWGGGMSKAERMMGGATGEQSGRPRAATSSSSKSLTQSLPASSSSRAANTLDALPNVDTHTLRTALASTPTLSSYKSSPNLSSTSKLSHRDLPPSLPTASAVTFDLPGRGKTQQHQQHFGGRRKLVAKDERSVRSERPHDLIDFLSNAPPPPTTTVASGAGRGDDATGLPRPNDIPVQSAAKGRFGSTNARLRNFLSPALGSKSSKRPSASPALPASHTFDASSHGFTAPSPAGGAPIDDFGRIVRSNLPVASAIANADRPTKSAGHSYSVSSSDGGLHRAATTSLTRPIVYEGKTTEDSDLDGYQGIYATLQDNIEKEGKLFLQQPDRTLDLTNLDVSSSPVRASMTPSASHTKASFETGVPGGPSVPPVNTQVTPTATPLLTPDNSKHDLYTLSRSSSQTLQDGSRSPASFYTPPNTPPHAAQSPYRPLLPLREEGSVQDGSVASATSPHRRQSDSDSKPGALAGPASPASPLRGTVPQTHQRRVSQIKRKPSPKIDEEDLLNMNPLDAYASRTTYSSSSQQAGSSRSTGVAVPGSTTSSQSSGSSVTTHSRRASLQMVSSSSSSSTSSYSRSRQGSHDGSVVSAQSTTEVGAATTETIYIGGSGPSSDTFTASSESFFIDPSSTSSLATPRQYRSTTTTSSVSSSLAPSIRTNATKTSRRASTIIMPLSPGYRGNASVSVSTSGSASASPSVGSVPKSPSVTGHTTVTHPGGMTSAARRSKMNIHDILLELRNNLVTSSTANNTTDAHADHLNELLDIIDNTIFVTAYDAGTDREQEGGKEREYPTGSTGPSQQAAFDDTAIFEERFLRPKPEASADPAWGWAEEGVTEDGGSSCLSKYYEAEIQNRVYLGILEWYLLKDEIAYPKRFQKGEPTVGPVLPSATGRDDEAVPLLRSCSTAPDENNAFQTSDNAESSAKKTPSLTYSTSPGSASGLSDDPQDGLDRHGCSTASFDWKDADQEEILAA